jgi:hypothetical protein
MIGTAFPYDRKCNTYDRCELGQSQTERTPANEDAITAAVEKLT